MRDTSAYRLLFGAPKGAAHKRRVSDRPADAGGSGRMGNQVYMRVNGSKTLLSTGPVGSWGLVTSFRLPIISTNLTSPMRIGR